MSEKIFKIIEFKKIMKNYLNKINKRKLKNKIKKLKESLFFIIFKWN